MFLILGSLQLSYHQQFLSKINISLKLTYIINIIYFFNFIFTFQSWPFKENSEPIYPTSLLETGYDIMFFWAFRMVGICHALSGKLPFNQLLFHGLIRDGQGRKMSKSIGNVIDPNDLICGASLGELKLRVNGSNLSESEKKISVKHQENIYPNGIEAVGSDALRLALLVQDFKCIICKTYPYLLTVAQLTCINNGARHFKLSMIFLNMLLRRQYFKNFALVYLPNFFLFEAESINIDISLFSDSKRYCNKIWHALNYYQIFHSDKKSKFRVMSINEV